MALSPDEFRTCWCYEEDEMLHPFPADSIAGLALSDESRAFLITAGLPDSAAPFLEFRVPGVGPLRSVTAEWPQAAEIGDFSQNYVIGFDSSGDPICLADGQIVVLNCDNCFQRLFLNSSIPQLAESLLVYRQFVYDTQERNGEDAWLDGDIPEDLLKNIHDELLRIDPAAVQPDRFWSFEMERLQEDFN